MHSVIACRGWLLSAPEEEWAFRKIAQNYAVGEQQAYEKIARTREMQSKY